MDPTESVMIACDDCADEGNNDTLDTVLLHTLETVTKGLILSVEESTDLSLV